MATTARQSTTPAPRRVTKNRRIAIRLSDELDAQLARAVAVSGRSQTELITEAIADKADEIIRQQHVLELSDRDMEALLAALASPPAPNAAMRRSVERWRARVAHE